MVAQAAGAFLRVAFVAGAVGVFLLVAFASTFMGSYSSKLRVEREK